MRIFIQLFGCLRQRCVCFQNLAGNRRIDIGNGLHGFNRAECLALRKRCSYFGQIDEHSVAQFMLRVVRDTDVS